MNHERELVCCRGSTDTCFSTYSKNAEEIGQVLTHLRVKERNAESRNLTVVWGGFREGSFLKILVTELENSHHKRGGVEERDENQRGTVFRVRSQGSVIYLYDCS
jgi:hypothetical protein